MSSILKIILFLLLLFNFHPTNILAMEFKDIDFVDGTLYQAKSGKYFSLEEDPDLRFYVSEDGSVEFIDKRNNVTLNLFNSAGKPIVIYRVEATKPKVDFYAVFDRSVRHDMKTDHFVLLGCPKKGAPYAIIADLETLKANGWSSEGLQLRVNEDKQLIIEGVTKVKSSPDNQVQPFLMNYQEDGPVTFTNLRAQQEAEDLPKILKGSSEFVLAGFSPGENIQIVSQKLGMDFVVGKEIEEEKDTEVDKKQEQGEADQEKDEQTTMEEENKQQFASHIYNKKLEFRYDKEDGTIFAIYTSSKDFASSRGITVGMNFEQLVEKYGHNYKRTRAPNLVINYIYSMEKQHPGSTDPMEIGFAVNSKGRIIMIFVDQWAKAIKE